jgi:hypothetical protein
VKGQLLRPVSASQFSCREIERSRSNSRSTKLIVINFDSTIINYFLASTDKDPLFIVVLVVLVNRILFNFVCFDVFVVNRTHANKHDAGLFRCSTFSFGFGAIFCDVSGMLVAIETLDTFRSRPVSVAVRLVLDSEICCLVSLPATTAAESFELGSKDSKSKFAIRLFV